MFFSAKRESAMAVLVIKYLTICQYSGNILSTLQNVERSLLSTAAGGWKQIIGQEAAMLNQIQSLEEIMDKIDNKEDLYSERAKFDLERSFSVSITSPSGSPFTGKSRSESCKSRQSFSSRHSSVDTDCLLESERNHLSHHNLSQV